MPEDLLERDDVQRRIGRAEAVVKVTRGVVHNFNNFLAVLLGRVELMLGQVDAGRLDPVPLRRGLLSMQQVTRDAAELLKRLRELTQPPPLETPAALDLNRVVQDAVEFVHPHVQSVSRTTGATIAIAPRLAPEGTTVVGQPIALREALVSLLLNAVEAMPAGGQITVETRRDGPQVLLSVADAGVGMTTEVLAHAFTPFFTTKGAASAGLGLSSAKDVVTRHGGTIAAESQPAAGAVFTVSLPAAPEPGPRSPGVGTDVPAGLEVLVVEDEADLGEVLDEFLRACGCRVTVTGDGTAAIEELGRHHYDLVLSDLLLPGAGGQDVARAAKHVSPRTAVILMSGQLTGDDVGEVDNRTIDAALAKPVDLSRLSRAIADVVARVGAPAN